MYHYGGEYMKSKVHVTLETDTMSELERIHKKTRIAKSVILDAIIKDGLEEIKKLNDNFTDFINKNKEEVKCLLENQN